MTIVILNSFKFNWPEQMKLILDILSFLYRASEMSLSYRCIIHRRITNISDEFLKVMAISILPIITIGISWVIWSLCCGSVSLNQWLKMQKNKMKTKGIMDKIDENGNKILKGASSFERRKLQEELRCSNTDISYGEISRRNLWVSFSMFMYISHTLIYFKTLFLFSCRELDPGDYWLSEDLDVR